MKYLNVVLIRGVLGSVGIKVSQTLLMFAVSVTLARVLGASQYGVYTYALVSIKLLTLPAQMGFPALIVREIAAYQTQRQWAFLKGLLHQVFQFVLVMSLFLMLLAGTGAWIWADHVTTEQLSTFMWAILLLPILALSSIRGAALRGLHKVVQGQLPEGVLRPLGFLFLLLAFSAWQNLSPVSAMMLHVFASVLAFVVGTVLLLRSIPTECGKEDALYESRRWILSALPLSLTAGMQLINSQADILILGYFTTTTDVGIYRVVVLLSSLILFGLQAISMVIAPYLSSLYVSGNFRQLQHLLKMAIWGSMTIALPVIFVFICWGDLILLVAFGSEYKVGHTALAILSIGNLMNAAMGVIGLVLNMIGYERLVARGIFIVTISNIVLNVVLVPMFGMVGAAMATTLALIAWSCILLGFARKYLRISNMEASMAVNSTN